MKSERWCKIWSRTLATYITLIDFTYEKLYISLTLKAADEISFLSEQNIIPVTSLVMILETREKCLLLIPAKLAATGKMFATWLHNTERYFLKSDPAPWSSISENHRKHKA